MIQYGVRIKLCLSHKCLPFNNKNYVLLLKRLIDILIIITDTSLIINKLGIDNIGYNPQLLKHKTSKISLICDIKGIPLEANIYSPFGPIRHVSKETIMVR